MKLAMYQMENAGTVQANLEKSLGAIRDAAAQGADLILFPEVQLTEFFPQYPGRDVSGYGIELESDIVKAFCDACRKYEIMAVPNIYLKEENNNQNLHLKDRSAAPEIPSKKPETFYDASLLIDKDGSILGVQKMVHVAQADQFYEQDYYTPSDIGFQVFDTAVGRIGIVVCFDRHYPESIRTEALMGADLILIPTVNTKTEPMKMFEMEICVQAFQNSVPIAMCNRVGIEDAMTFAGESLVVAADGTTCLKADDTECILYAEIPIEKTRQIRQAKSYTTLRRKEMYL
jgi:predicted amidohydrolase